MKVFILLIFLPISLYAQWYIDFSAGNNFNRLSLSKDSPQNEYFSIKHGNGLHWQLNIGQEYRFFAYSVGVSRHLTSDGFRVYVAADSCINAYCTGTAGSGIGATFRWGLSAYVAFPLPIIKEKLFLTPQLAGMIRFYPDRGTLGPYSYYDTDYLTLRENLHIKQRDYNLNFRYGLEICWKIAQQHALLLTATHNIGLNILETIPYYLLVKTTNQSFSYNVEQRGSYVGLYLGYRYYLPFVSKK